MHHAGLLHSVFCGSARPLRLMLGVALCMVLAACGFRMKGVSPLPFDAVYTNIASNTAFGSSLQRALKASSPGLQFVGDPAQADVNLMQISSREWLRELSLDAQGRVEEYELNLEFIFQVTDRNGALVLPPTTLRSTRELPYNDAHVQAQQQEIDAVFRNMRLDLIERISFLLASPAVRNAVNNPQAEPYQETLQPEPSPSPANAGPQLWGAPQVDGRLQVR